MLDKRRSGRASTKTSIGDEIAHLRGLDLKGLRSRWQSVFQRPPSDHLPRHLLFAIITYRIQADRLGDLDHETRQLLDRTDAKNVGVTMSARLVSFDQKRTELAPGTVLVREWDRQSQRVMVMADGIAWSGQTFDRSLLRDHRNQMERSTLFWPEGQRRSVGRKGSIMKAPPIRFVRCAIYTRVSTEHGLDQEFNSPDAQYDAASAYIMSQAHAGWTLIRSRYDDGGYSGGSTDRPDLQKMLDDIRARKIDVIVVYKVDRLTRSLADFAKLVELFDAHDVSFVSVTQQFNTTTSMGRLTLNVLLSFAQFEREVTGERIRDKIAASKKKGMWMGGVVPLGYRVEDRALHVVEDHAAIMRSLFRRYLEAGSVARLKQQLDAEGVRIPIRVDGAGRSTGGGLFSRGHIYKILSNPIYVGRIAHKGQIYGGNHPPIVTGDLRDKVQQSLGDHLGAARTKRTRQSSDALLAGKLYDDGGNRMSPTWARKGSKRWRYYVSQAALEVTRAKRHRSCAFQPLMSKLSWRRP